MAEDNSFSGKTPWSGVQAARSKVMASPTWQALFGQEMGPAAGLGEPADPPRSRRERRERDRRQRGPVVATTAILAAATAGTLAGLLSQTNSATTLGEPPVGAFPNIAAPTQAPRTDVTSAAAPARTGGSPLPADRTVLVTPRVRGSGAAQNPAAPTGSSNVSGATAGGPGNAASPSRAQNPTAAGNATGTLIPQAVPPAIAVAPTDASGTGSASDEAASLSTGTVQAQNPPGTVIPASIAEVPDRAAYSGPAWPMFTYTLRSVDGSREPAPFPATVTGYQLIDRSRTSVRLQASRYFLAVGDLPTRTATYQVCRDQRFYVRWMAVDPTAYVDATLVDEHVSTVQNVPVHGSGGWMSSYGCVQPALRITPSEGAYPASATIIVETEVWQR